MADGSSNLEIVITAVDEATAAFEEMTESLDGVADSAATMVDATTASFNEFTASVAAAAEATGLDEIEIMRQMEATGLTAQEVADQIVAANEEVDTSNDLTKGSFMSIGIVAGIAFAAVSSAVDSAVTSAQSWDEETAIIAQTLKDTGSAIPVSQVQAYAQQVQSTTLLTQQQALQSEGLILSYKNLQPQYQSLTMLSADLATKMSQVSGTMTDNLPNATKILTTALEDPVAGINQLIRQGTVAFPAATVTMIENMAKVGDTAGADALILDTLNGKVGGMAQAAAQAPGAGLTQLSNSLTTLATQVGNDLLPDLDALAKALLPIITDVTNWAAAHPKLTEALVVGIVVFTALLAVLSLVGIIIAAVGSAFAAAAVSIAAAVALVAAAVISNWTLIKTDTETIWTDVSNFIGTIWTTIENTVKAGVNDVISVINGFINALDSIHISLPSIKIPGTSLATPAINLGFTIPDIPMLAAGGFVTQPTLALIGEAGPESVTSLSKMGSGGAGGQQIVVNINGGSYLDTQGATMIANALAKQVLRGLKVTGYAP